MNIVILGSQGSGKGTQAKLLAEKYGLTQIETGKLLRDIAETDHPWGKRIKSMMLKGVLVSDKILMAVLKQTLAKPAGKGRIFDGTPRNLPQYELIKNILKSRGEKLDRVIMLKVSEAEAVKRISARRICKNCGRIYNLITDPPPGDLKCECKGELVQREDDYPDVIKKRLKAFNKSTLEVAKRALREGILLEIDGERPVEEIYREIVSWIN